MLNELELGEDTGSRAHALLQAVGTTAVSAMLAAGLGAWLLLAQGGTGPAAESRPDERGAVAVVGQSADGSRLPLFGAGRTDEGDYRNDPVGPAPPAAPTYYIVATQEQADAVLVGIHEAAAIRSSFNEPFAEEQVVLLISGEEEARFRRALDELDTLRGGMGLPPARVVDLRAQPAQP